MLGRKFCVREALLLSVLAFASIGAVQMPPRLLQVSLLLLEPEIDPVEVVLVVSPEIQSGQPAGEALKLLARTQSETVLSIPFAGPARLEIDSESLWAPVIQAESDALAVSIPVFQAASLTFLPTANGKPVSAEQVEVRFTAAPGQREPDGFVVAGDASCVPSEASNIVCRMPALSLDLRIWVPGYAPVYQWGVDLKDHQELMVGKLALVVGGSVSGFTVDENGEVQAGTEVTAQVPKTDRRDDLQARRFELLAQSATSNDRGFFQIVGLGPATYVLSARKEGFAETAASEAIVIRDDLEETLRETIMLQRPGEFELGLSPPLDPLGKPWRVRLFSPSDRAQDFSGKTVDGAWLQQNIVSGQYALLVNSSDGARWLGEEIRIESGLQSRRFDIPVVRIVGTVSRGDEPVKGRLIFLRKKSGSEMGFWLDEDGAFEGSLPSHGRWELQVSDDDQAGAKLALEAIEVEAPKGTNPVEVEVEIPDTLLSGRVVDADGRPVDGTRVYLLKDSLLSQSEFAVDEEAEFGIRGLSPGRHNLFAGAFDGRSSEVQLVDLYEDRIAPELRLVLLDMIDLSGQVVTEDGQPIIGASLLFWVHGEAGSLSSVQRLTTGVTGEFFKTVPPAGSASVLVQAPGFGAKMVRHSLDGKRPLIVELSQRAGNLRLSIPGLYADTAESGETSRAVFLGYDGTFLPLGSVLRSMDKNPRSETYELATMSSGLYSLCALQGDHAYDLEAGLPLDSCDQGFLAVGGQLDLTRSDP